MTHNPESAEGCFQASYPNYLWQKTECKVAQPRVHPVHPTVTGVTSETGVGVAAFGGGGILGPNEYTLQINTNFTGTTSVCAGHSGCTVWQQLSIRRITTYGARPRCLCSIG